MNIPNERTTYEGWVNWETWNVNLWMDNDYGQYCYWQDQIKRIAKLISDKQKAIALLAKKIKGQYTTGRFHSDLKRSHFAKVNWIEIAESQLTEAWDKARLQDLKNTAADVDELYSGDDMDQFERDATPEHFQ